METRITFLDGEALFIRSREYLSKSVEEQNFLFHDRHLNSFATYRVTETDTHIYWAEDHFKPRFNGKLFYTNNGKSGISLDKRTRDVKLWFGKKPHITLINSFYAYMSCDWQSMLPRAFDDYFTVSLAKDIAKGKVSSIVDFATHLSKRSLLFKGIEPETITKLIYSLRFNYSEYYVSLDLVGTVLKVAKDPIAAIDFICTSVNNIYPVQELARKAICINEKVDFSCDASYRAEKERISSLYTKQGEDFGINVGLPF
jgi:hypothetical protein